jgi:phosphopantetheinyl transferase (holo-ACP synthase)
VRLSGGAAARARTLGVREIAVSLSHTSTVAAASAAALREGA